MAICASYILPNGTLAVGLGRGHVPFAFCNYEYFIAFNGKLFSSSVCTIETRPGSPLDRAVAAMKALDFWMGFSKKNSILSHSDMFFFSVVFCICSLVVKKTSEWGIQSL